MSIIVLIRDWVIDPIGLLFLLSLFLFGVMAFKRLTLCLVVSFFVWVGSVCLVSAPRLVNPMLLALENQFEEEPACLDARPIVLLGGGVDSRAGSSADAHYMDPATFIRALKAKELAQRFPDVPVLVAGGALVEISEAAVIGQYLSDAGIAANRIYEEGRSRNTFENGVNIRALIDDREFDERITLITSALHMKRAQAVFEKQGLQVCAVAVDRQGIRNVPNYAMWPQISAMVKFDFLLHEVLALLIYKITGRI